MKAYIVLVGFAKCVWSILGRDKALCRDRCERLLFHLRASICPRFSMPSGSPAQFGGTSGSPEIGPDVFRKSFNNISEYSHITPIGLTNITSDPLDVGGLVSRQRSSMPTSYYLRMYMGIAAEHWFPIP